MNETILNYIEITIAVILVGAVIALFVTFRFPTVPDNNTTYAQTEHVEMTVVEKYTYDDSYMTLIWIIPIWHHRTNYVLEFDNGKCTVDISTYKNTYIGDTIKCYKTTYYNKNDDTIVQTVYTLDA